MTQTMKKALVALLVAVCVVRAEAQQPQLDGPDPQGAVLCAWLIYVTLQAVGERCFLGNSETIAAIDESIEKIETFVFVNAPATRDEIAAKRKHFRSLVIDAPAPYCSDMGEPFKMYRSMQAVGPTRIRNEVANLLAVPRKPVWNPCL
jgi:hypothetical protein